MISDGGGNGSFLSWMPLKAEPKTKPCTWAIYLFGRWSQGIGMRDRSSETKWGKQLGMPTGSTDLVSLSEDSYKRYFKTAHEKWRKTEMHVCDWPKVSWLHMCER